MYSHIKTFLNSSIVYFVGNAFNRLGVFLLLPLYTNYLIPEEYGSLELVFVTVAMARIFLGMCLGHATLRFFFEYESEHEKKKLMSTILLFTIFWCLILTIVLMLLSDYLSVIVFKTSDYSMLLIIGFAMMFFEVVTEIPFAFLRAKDRSKLYVFSSLSYLVLRIGIVAYIVICLSKGVQGILFGNLVSSFFLCFFLSMVVFKYSGISFDVNKLKDVWKYSYPLVISSIPHVFVKNVDRIVLGWYTSLEVVGIYALAFRFGLALQGFVLDPFQLGFGPFRFSIMKQENAKEVYARILTYFVFAVTFVALLVTLLCREVIELMASADFISAYKVVPIIILSVLVNGVIYIFQTGMLIEKRTDYFSYVSIISAVLNVLALFIFVPVMGIYGAGLSLLVTSLVQAILTFWFSQKCYKITFEFQRFVKIMFAFFLVYFLSMITSDMGLYERLFFKSIMILVFPILLVPLRFYRREEIEGLRAFKEKFSIKVFSVIGVNRR